MSNMDVKKMETGISMFLEGLGVDLQDQHIKGTPERVMRSWRDYFGTGYHSNPKDVLSIGFEEGYDNMVIVKDIPFNWLSIGFLSLLVVIDVVILIVGKTWGIQLTKQKMKELHGRWQGND